MDAAGLGLSTIELCIKFGKELYDICQKYRRADRDIRESILSIEGIWLKTQVQVDTIRNVWDSLDGRVQIHQNLVLSVLQEKLQLAISVINSLDTVAASEPSMKDLLINVRGESKKLKYAVYVKNKLDTVLKDLDQWQKQFDPSWYLLTRAAISSIDQSTTAHEAGRSDELHIIQKLRSVIRKNNEPVESKTSVFLAQPYPISERVRIDNSSAQIGHAANRSVIIDSLLIAQGVNPQLATKDVRDIARILANVDTTVFGLLMCRGVIKLYDNSLKLNGFEFLFALPRGFSNPQSLRSLLLAPSHRYSLDGRFRLARLLARSISFLHSAQIVHKNISPETVLLLENKDSGLDTPFLVGFEKFRRADDRTYMSGDTLWEKNLYRHPKRQGERPEEEYKMQHDIYSLGVCLLEIGLGFSFVCFDSASISAQNPKGAIPNPTLDAANQLNNKDVRARASQVKRKLTAMAEEHLPSRMGKVYANVVLSCLTCLDPNNQGFGDESDFMDEDGLLVGVRYIEKILYSLEEIKF